MNALEMARLANDIDDLARYEFEFIKPEYRTKFNYALVKNRKKIVSALQALSEVKENDPKWKEYEKKRVELCKELAQKNPNTKKPIIKNNSYFLGDNTKEFTDKLEILRKEYEGHLMEDVDIEKDFHIIEEDWLPVSTNWTAVRYSTIEAICK
jgi:hypothetical protein